uniref:Uncharacterized protein n=1 Tax=Paramoeba aestuarina TaxID=180227 RepID=A0A7S4KGY0_9EUKA|mmetsp:Transcript_19077/g.29892  ORF Transcript_19077/g.29892 Transcript_19077/m.29892 type:complete len:292 (+) Transcript_19077:24-899(+)
MRELIAEDLVKRAEAKLKGFFTFFTGTNWDAANDLFKKAAAIFKSEGKWQQAGAAFKRAAQCCRELDFSYEACTNYFEAAGAFRKAGDSTDAIACWDEALQMYIEENRFHQAGKVECEIGDMCAEQRDFDEAIKHYRQSIFYYLTDDYGKNIANRIQKKVATAYVESGKLSDAANEFDKLANCDENRQLKSLSRDHHFSGMLCLVGLLRKDNLVEGVASVREKLATLSSDSSQVKTREYELVEQVCAAVEEGSPEGIREAIHHFQDVKQMDDWKTSILYGLIHVLETDDER